MKFKLSTISLTVAGFLSATATTTFANEAPVVDIQQKQENSAVSTQPEQSSSGSWQVVSNGNAGSNANAPSDKTNTPSSQNQNDSWQPASNQPSSNTDQSGGAINQRMSRLEQQVANYNQMNLPQQMSDLQQKVAQLQGQLEVEQHALKALTDQQKLYYQDISQQLSQLQRQPKQIKTSDNSGVSAPTAAQNTNADVSGKSESEFASKTSRSSSLAVKKSNKKKDLRLDTAQAPASAATEINDAKDKEAETTVASNDDSAGAASDTADKKPVLLGDADAYDRAFKALSNKNFKSAQTEFQDYLSSYPKGRFAVNAHFWLGEIGLMHEKYDTALKHFQTVVTDYASSNKVPDAKLKIAMIHAATGKMDVARQEFTQIRKSYPGTTAAQLASIRLQQLANATSVNVQ